jgi:hypothetical protein
VRASGILIALPVVAGPILLVITIEHGDEFGARAARGSLLGVVALSVFCVVFARVARSGWVPAVAASWLGYGAVAAAGARWDAAPLAGLVVALVALAIARLLLAGQAPGDEPEPTRPWWDLYARAGSTAALVIAITTAADALGPGVSGVLTPFPVATTVLAAFAAAHDGPCAAATMLGGFVMALPAFALFFFVVALGLG